MKDTLRSVAPPACRFLLLLGLVLAAAHASLAVADPLPAPSGPVILTVDGAIANTNKNDKATFDRALLESLGMTALATSTPWEPGVFTFEGVLLSTLLDKVGAKGKTLIAQGVDGYQVDIPVEDSRAYDVILALKRDGHWMSVRDKGPVWIIYPIDRHPEIRNEFFSARSVWQLARLTVR